jgi:hypothetical protein
MKEQHIIFKLCMGHEGFGTDKDFYKSSSYTQESSQKLPLNTRVKDASLLKHPPP